MPKDASTCGIVTSQATSGGRSREIVVLMNKKDRYFGTIDFGDVRWPSKAPPLAYNCPALLTWIIWKRPSHPTTSWRPGRAERARQRAVASHLAWCVHVQCTSTVSARWVLRARRSGAGVSRIGARSDPAAHRHASDRPEPRPPAAAVMVLMRRCASSGSSEVMVVREGRARARSRMDSVAHRVPSTAATPQAMTLHARSAVALLLRWYSWTVLMRAIWVQVRPCAGRAGHGCKRRVGAGALPGRQGCSSMPSRRLAAARGGLPELSLPKLLGLGTYQNTDLTSTRSRIPLRLQ